jgi:hypothetical protein
LVNLLNFHKVLTRLLTCNNSQSMVPFSYSDHQLLLSVSTFTDCSHFLNITFEDANVVPQALWPYDPFTPWYMMSQQNIQSSLSLEDFWFATFFHHTHLFHMTTSEESLRVLFFTLLLTIDLVH